MHRTAQGCSGDSLQSNYHQSDDGGFQAVEQRSNPRQAAESDINDAQANRINYGRQYEECSRNNSTSLAMQLPPDIDGKLRCFRPRKDHQWLSAFRNLVLLIHRFFSTNNSSCITAIWAAVPPKLIPPSLNQKRSVSWNDGLGAAEAFILRRPSSQKRDTENKI